MTDFLTFRSQKGKSALSVSHKYVLNEIFMKIFFKWNRKFYLFNLSRAGYWMILLKNIFTFGDPIN